jgi:hypothetical protein
MRDIIPSRGGAAHSLILEVEGELTGEDIFQLLSEKPARTAAPILQKTSAVHHRIARHMAAGRDSVEIAIIVGRTAQRINDLKKDPTFQNLVAYYSEQIIDIEVEDGQRIQGKFKDMTEGAQDEILRRLENDDELRKIPISELRQIAQLGADRTDAPPRQAQAQSNAPQNITFNIGARDLTPKDDPQVIEGTAEVVKE